MEANEDKPYIWEAGASKVNEEDVMVQREVLAMGMGSGIVNRVDKVSMRSLRRQN